MPNSYESLLVTPFIGSKPHKIVGFIGEEAKDYESHTELE